MHKYSTVISLFVIVLAVLGMLDSLYLTIEHYSGAVPPCGIHWWLTDCGKVLQSRYSIIFGVPLSLIGVFHYSFEFMLAVFVWRTKKRWATAALSGLTIIGAASSLVFVYLMFGVLRAICLYCLGSALISFLLFFCVPVAYRRSRTWFFVYCASLFYRVIGKPLFFRLDPEFIHVRMVKTGELLGKLSISAVNHSPLFAQQMHGIKFSSPIGLAAGFDYEARLTQILSPLGFGFQTVGTVTYRAYEGNPRPMLGRLPNSRSLMVNKGYKNPGASAIRNKLEGLHFPIPVGISIGRSNSRIKGLTQTQSVADICRAFETFETSAVHHSYYELNISCPNLFGTVSFYPPKNLHELLKEVDALHVSRPIFIKMPISKSFADTRRMLEVISSHSPVGVIIGNLQTNRKHPLLDRAEVRKFSAGNFSGRPTFQDSNDRISMCYQTFGSRFTIIGCGGVFSGADAFEKISRGASLVQLITGMIYEGPQLITQINLEVEELLKAKGFRSIKEAVGSAV